MCRQGKMCENGGERERGKKEMLVTVWTRSCCCGGLASPDAHRRSFCRLRIRSLEQEHKVRLRHRK